MADTNTVYQGTTDVTDPDVVIFQNCVGVEIFGYCTGHWEDIHLPEELRTRIRAANSDAVNTTQAVQIAYTGSTSSERKQWLTNRLNAINARALFITARMNELLSTLKDSGADTYDTMVKLVSTGLALVPVIGSVVTFATNQAATAKAIGIVQVQNLIQNYAKDLAQLAEIRKQLLKDLTDLDTTATPVTTSQNSLYSAAKAIPATYYIFGALLLIVLLYAYKKNRSKR